MVRAIYENGIERESVVDEGGKAGGGMDVDKEIG